MHICSMNYPFSAFGINGTRYYLLGAERLLRQGSSIFLDRSPARSTGTGPHISNCDAETCILRAIQVSLPVTFFTLV